VRRVLLLGKGGQLGWELLRSLAPLGEVIALDRRGNAVSSQRNGGLKIDTVLCGDLSRPTELETTVRLLKPDCIVNAAAYTEVDKAESVPEVARLINAEAPGTLARVGAELGAWLIHYSTDYVFDGTGSVPWREDDTPGPLGAYGQTKLEGEERIRASGCRHLILRTSWVYAARRVNFARTILRLAGQRDTLQVVDDQIGSPTGADLLADTTAHAVRAVTQTPELAGTYHVAASGETSWYEYARFVIESARARGWTLKVSADGLIPVPSSAYVTPARRPYNSRLDCTKLEKTLGLCLPSWKFGVARLIDALEPS